MRYIDILHYVVNNYNNTVHSRTKFAPIDINKSNEKIAFNNLYKNLFDKPKEEKFLLDDLVRIAKLKKYFEKGYTNNWTNELFKISKIIHSLPNPKYQIADLKGKKILGTFYEKELQKVQE